MDEARSWGDGPGTIIVGFDGSPTAEHALFYALGAARRRRSELVVVYVTAPVVATGPFGVTAVATDHGTVAELRSRVHALTDQYDVHASFLAVSGEPSTALARVAAERRADAVVVGASTAMLHRVFGSIAARLIRRCHCPVTVVP